MPTWYPFVMLVLGGFFIGGAYSFFKTQRRGVAGMLGAMAVLCLISALLTWSPPQT